MSRANRSLALFFVVVASLVGGVAAPREEAASSTIHAYMFISPNTKTDLNLATARRQLQSEEHRYYRYIADNILRELGVRGHQVQDAVGDWEGSAENSLMVSLTEPANPTTVTCAAAWFGLAAKQKAVLIFHADDNGPDLLATIELADDSLEQTRSLLDRHGFRDRTLVPSGDGWRAVVVAEGTRKDALERLPAKVRVQRGQMQLLGGSTEDGARQRYREVIRVYHKTSELPPLAKLGW